MGTIFNSKVFKGVSVAGKIVEGMAKNGVVFWQDIDVEVGIFASKTVLTDTEKYALDKFVKDLKQANLYDKIKVLYPMIGSTSSSCSLDLISSNNNIFNLKFFGGWVFDKNGITPNGINTYANSNFKPSERIVLCYEGYTISIGTFPNDTTPDPVVIGSMNGLSQASLMVITEKTNRFTTRLNGTFRKIDTQGVGIYSISAIGNNGLMKKSNSVLTFTRDGTLPTLDVYLGNMTYGSGAYGSGYTTKRIQTTVFHKGLTEIEITYLQTIISDFENSLGRKTW